MRWDRRCPLFGKGDVISQSIHHTYKTGKCIEVVFCLPSTTRGEKREQDDETVEVGNLGAGGGDASTNVEQDNLDGSHDESPRGCGC